MLAPTTAPTVRPSVEAVDRVVAEVYRYAYGRAQRDLWQRLADLLGLKDVPDLPD